MIKERTKSPSNPNSIDVGIKILLVMVLLGSILGIENAQSYGFTFVFDEYFIVNTLLLIVSCGLLFGALRTKLLKVAAAFLGVELLIWLVKYLLHKGGYITTHVDGVNPFIAIYDIVAIGIRLFLLFTLLDLKKIRTVVILVVPILFLGLKTKQFSMPVLDQRISDKFDMEAREQRLELIGAYSGELFQSSDSSLKTVSVHIDSAYLKIYSEEETELDSIYSFELEFTDNGFLYLGESFEYNMHIKQSSEDSVIFEIYHYIDPDYVLRLEKRGPHKTPKLETSDLNPNPYQSQADSIALSYENAQKVDPFNRQQWDQQFFDAFPSSFAEMEAVFGYETERKRGPLYSYAQDERIIQYFGNLESIPDSLYFDKYIRININGNWQANNIRDAFGISQRILSDTESVSQAMSAFSDAEIKSVFRFIFDGPHPNHDGNARLYEELKAKLEIQNERLSELLTEAYDKLIQEDHGH